MSCPDVRTAVKHPRYQQHCRTTAIPRKRNVKLLNIHHLYRHTTTSEMTVVGVLFLPGVSCRQQRDTLACPGCPGSSSVCSTGNTLILATMRTEVLAGDVSCCETLYYLSYFAWPGKERRTRQNFQLENYYHWRHLVIIHCSQNTAKSELMRRYRISKFLWARAIHHLAGE